MAYYPFAPENGAYYTLSNPNNSVYAIFNDPTSTANVGMITDISGLDSPEVRESAEDLVQADGGTHGYFYFSRRPIVITANVFGHASVAERNLKVDTADRAAQLLRNDGTLSWKPSNRIENLILNPKAAVDLSNRTTGASTGFVETRTTTNLPAGFTTGILVTATAVATTAAGGNYSAPGSGANGMPVYPGQQISAGFSAKLLSVTSGAAASIQARLYWWKADGSSSTTSSTTIKSQSSPVIGTDYLLDGVVTVPSDAYYCALRIIVGQTNPSSYTLTYTGLKFAQSSTVVPYIDGDLAGYYWNGNSNASISGDFIEMFTPVRRNGPFRQTGGWIKELNIPLVSEYATLQGTFLKNQSAAGGASMTLENRGSWPAWPVLQITGASASNPIVKNTTPTPDLEFKTTGGLIIAAGETMEVDTLNHTAYFTAGARNGQSANRFIDYANTTWPCMPTGNSAFTLTGTGTLNVQWRDTWV